MPIRTRETRILFIALLGMLPLLLLNGCAQKTDLAADLPGVWACEQTGADGGTVMSFYTIATDLTYRCQFTRVRTNGLAEGTIAGSFQVSDGWLVDTIREHSESNWGVPTTVRGRILEYQDGNLLVRWEGQVDPVTFRKDMPKKK